MSKITLDEATKAFNAEMERLNAATGLELSEVYLTEMKLRADSAYTLTGFCDISGKFNVRWMAESPGVLKLRVLGAMYQMRREIMRDIEAIESLPDCRVHNEKAPPVHKRNLKT